MRVIRRSTLTWKVHEMDLPVTQAQLDEHARGRCVQDVFPELTLEQREFIISGITPEEWNSAFPEVE